MLLFAQIGFHFPYCRFVTQRSLCLGHPPHNKRVLAWIRGGVEEVEAEWEGAVLEDAVEVVEHVFLVEVGDDLLEAEDYLGVGGVDLEFISDLVERDSGGGLFPFRFGQFQELV